MEHKEEGEGGGEHHQGIGEDVEGEGGRPPQPGVGGPLKGIFILVLYYHLIKMKITAVLRYSKHWSNKLIGNMIKKL